jgi:hypothetical protein
MVFKQHLVAILMQFAADDLVHVYYMLCIVGLQYAYIIITKTGMLTLLYIYYICTLEHHRR